LSFVFNCFVINMAAVKYKYSVKDVIRMLEDSDEELSHSSDTDDVQSDVDESATDSDVNDQAIALPADTAMPVYDWQNYPDIDPWESSWLPNFQKCRGVLVDTTDFQPLQYFKLFFPDSVFELMSSETNRYADQFFESRAVLSPKSRFRNWKPTTPEEMKGFIALHIEMGLDWRYRVDEHWSTRPLSPGCFAVYYNEYVCV